jgi:glucose-6-phosphate isomerase
MMEANWPDVSLKPDELDFIYGPGTVGPMTEKRTLDAIRPSLLDPNCSGPDPVYGIAMDVAREKDLPLIEKRMLIYGMVAYAAGRLGDEPPRSQGHVHSEAAHSGWSPPELFQILEGRAIIYAQAAVDDDPGACVAVTAEPGDKVVMPPSWAHCVINADPAHRMVFAAWCDRQYGFVYDGIRRRGGLAWFPVLTSAGNIEWQPNQRYRHRVLEVHPARSYPELQLRRTGSIYEQFIADPESLMWVSDPARMKHLWHDFRP